MLSETLESCVRFLDLPRIPNGVERVGSSYRIFLGGGWFGHSEDREAEIQEGVLEEFELATLRSDEGLYEFKRGLEVLISNASRHTNPETQAVVVAMAGIILPAILLVSILSTGRILYAIALKLEAWVMKSTWWFVSSSFSKSSTSGLTTAEGLVSRNSKS